VWVYRQVVLALQILDGAPFRTELTKPMTVQRAKFEMHGDQFVPKKRSNKKKKKGAVAAERMLGWDGFDDLKKPTEVSMTCPTQM
jgi:HIV Tat-specific factor 1